MTQVKETETTSLAEESDNWLIYDEIIADEEVKIYYSFRADALMKVGLSYAALEDETDHVELARILTEKYEAPAEENTDRSGSHHQKWLTPRTTIEFSVCVKKNEYIDIEVFELHL